MFKDSSPFKKFVQKNGQFIKIFEKSDWRIHRLPIVFRNFEATF